MSQTKIQAFQTDGLVEKATNGEITAVLSFGSKYDEKVNARGSISGAQTIDLLLGTYVTATITGATVFSITNPSVSGRACGFVLELTNGGAGTITWPTGTKWTGGVAPTLTAAGIDLLGFISRDGGVSWRGMLLSKDNK